MAGLTQIGQVPGDTTPQVRRLLNSLVNTPDQWITGGTLSVQASGERTGKIDLDTEGATLGQVLRFNGTNPEWSSEITVNITGTVSDISNHGIGDLSDVTYTNGDLEIDALDTFTTTSTSAGVPGRILTVSGGDTAADSTSRSIGGGDLILSAGQSVGSQVTTTLAADIAANDTLSLTVADSTGFPAATSSDSSTHFDVLINREIVTVTNVDGTTWTIVRAQRNTSAPTSHASGSTVTHLSGSVRLQTASYAGSGGTVLNGLNDVLIATPDGKIGLGVDPASGPSGTEGTLSIMGIPSTTNRYILAMTENYTESSGHQSGAVFSVNASQASAEAESTASTFGLFMDCGTSNGDQGYYSNNEAFVGGKFTVRNRGDKSGGTNSGRIAMAQCGSFALSNTGTIDDARGINIDTIKKTDVIKGYGIYQFGSNDVNFLGGSTGIKTEDPDTPFHVVGATTTEYSYSTVDVPTSVPAGDLLNNAEVLGTAKAITVATGNSFTSSYSVSSTDTTSATPGSGIILELNNTNVFVTDYPVDISTPSTYFDVAIYDLDGDFEVMTVRRNLTSPDTLEIEQRNVNGGGAQNLAASSEVRVVLHAPDDSLPITVAIADTDGLETGVAKIVNSRTGHFEYVNISSVDPDVSVTVDARGLANSSKMYITGAPSGLETISMVKASPAVLPLNARAYIKNTYAKDHTEDSSESNIIIKSQSADLHPTAQTTTLDGAISSTDTELDVDSFSGFPGSGNYNIRIGSEEMTVTGGQGTLTWTVSRGQRSTIAQSHADEAVVTHQVDHDRYLYASLSKSPVVPTVVMPKTTGGSNRNDVTCNSYHGIIRLDGPVSTTDVDYPMLQLTGTQAEFTVFNDKVSVGDLVLVNIGEIVGTIANASAVQSITVQRVVDGSFQIRTDNRGAHWEFVRNPHVAGYYMTFNFRVIPSSALLWNASTTEP